MNKREKKMTSSLQPSGEKVSGKEGNPVDKLSRLQHEVFTLTEELKSQKELVRLLHKALEAAQQEKRTSKQFLAAAGEQEWLELVRHKEVYHRPGRPPGGPAQRQGGAGAAAGHAGLPSE
ncbi:TBC1 domain family member 2A-like isoform X1 [Acipenser ruthenus]|uniref:TBC1 domain family member 2A-like isoform X1 n=1 Tax=Acipenser ruthenus TaxID=7906 RepID=UPI002741FF78|nr:TBC1 domain family member 2A-like isoform X1 [Acipenser ruthenus]